MADILRWPQCSCHIFNDCQPDFKIRRRLDTISGPVSLEGQIVKVMLRTGIEDKGTPAGGMKFNLHRTAP
jgi:hypothetical protein